MAKIAFIIDEMFEDSEFEVPYERAKEAGHEPVIIGLEAGKKLEGKKGEVKITTEKSIDEVDADEFDALVIPGGYSPDKIRTQQRDGRDHEGRSSRPTSPSRRSVTPVGCWPKPTSSRARR